MKSCRINVMGASGSGVTSLGRALADALAIPHHDTDDYLWQPTTPPFRVLRDIPERLRLMREMFLPRADWVLSGGLAGWGDALIPLFDQVISLTTPSEIRLRRLRARSPALRLRCGGSRRHRETEWASHYEDGDREGRSFSKDKAWLAALRCPVPRLDGSRPLPELVAACLAALSRATLSA